MTICTCKAQLQPHDWMKGICPDPKLAPHPGENHAFRTSCILCGEAGWLHVALITNNETVTIAAREEPKP